MVRSAIPSKPCQNCTNRVKTVHLTNNTIHYGNYELKYRFPKCQFYFSYILEKIANIRKYRKNDEYFPHSE